MRRSFGRGAAIILVLAAPALAHAQVPGAPRERTGPRATPPPAPTYAQPAPGLANPVPPAATPILRAPPSDRPLAEVRVTADPGVARPPRGWTPPADAASDLRLEHAEGQPLDAAWVRAQFALNGLPAQGGVSRALALVQRINRAFLSAGFVNSGVLAEASPAPGVLALRVVYGGLAAPAPGQPPVSVTWDGGHAKGLDADYVIARMPSAQQRPLSAADLEHDFRLLAEDPAIRTINAELRPGAHPGEASLGLSIYPADRYDLYVSAANDRSPTVGGERLAAGGAVRNVLGAGDLLTAEVGWTDGLDDAELGYVFPFLSPKNLATVRASYNNAAVTDQLLAPLDITAKERDVEAGLARKVIDEPLLPAGGGHWRPARTLALGVSVDWREAKSYLFGEPFSFAPGAVNGRARYTALRLTGDYIQRSTDKAFAASVTATFGLSGTRSDIPGLENPHSDFHAVLAQLNYAQRLTADGLELRARFSGQWADGVLYSGERFSAGGETTVRGYRENLLLSDRGAVGSVELARPIRLSSHRAAGTGGFVWDSFTASVFADGAVVRNAGPPQPPQRTIGSLGASLFWQPSDGLTARLTYAYALRNVSVAGERDLQDRGISFRVTLRPLLFFRD